MSEEAKPKYSNVAPDDPAYRLLDELIGAHHAHLSEAKIALVWAHAFKADRDGHVVWGQAKKVSPLERQFHEHDFVLLLNDTVWAELGTKPNAQKALLDHELHHCGAATDDDGEVSYHTCRHDLEEFVAVVRRYGLWRQSVEDLVNAAVERQRAVRGDEADAADDE